MCQIARNIGIKLKKALTNTKQSGIIDKHSSREEAEGTADKSARKPISGDLQIVNIGKKPALKS